MRILQFESVGGASGDMILGALIELGVDLKELRQDLHSLPIERCEIEVAYAIGVAHPLSVMVETFGTGSISDEKIAELVVEHFDLRPGAIIQDLNLRRPIYRQVAAYGHFGRDDLDLPWERTDKAEVLRQAAGIAVNTPVAAC